MTLEEAEAWAKQQPGIWVEKRKGKGRWRFRACFSATYGKFHINAGQDPEAALVALAQLRATHKKSNRYHP